MSACIWHILDGCRAAGRIDLTKASLSVGRDNENDVVLDDARVSGRHSEFRRTRTGWRVHDLSSRNGVFVDGTPREQASLSDGSVVRIGDSHFVFGQQSPPGTTSISAAGHLLTLQLDRASRSDAPVLLVGPTGAGKGHCARLMTNASRRGPGLVTVNCAALPRDLIEAELFGFEKGAFTGATQAKAGLVEAANGKTLFLDEIGELSPQLQAKLLGVIEENTVRRVGSIQERHVDVRFVAATNVDIKTAVAQGRFRADLYYRLAARLIDVPPLNRRRADIPAMLIELAGPEFATRLTPEATEALLIHDWPGNVRELANAVSFVAEEPNGLLDYHALPQEFADRLRERRSCGAPPVSQLPNAPSRSELETELNANDGNVSAVARQLGVHRTQLNRWLRAYGLRP